MTISPGDRLSVTLVLSANARHVSKNLEAGVRWKFLVTVLELFRGVHLLAYKRLPLLTWTRKGGSMTEFEEAEVSTYQVCGVPIMATSLQMASMRLRGAAVAGRKQEVHLCNAYTLSLLHRDRRLKAILLRADLNLPDGVPVAWLGRQHGVSGPVRGPSLITRVMEDDVRGRLRHYLYGGAQGVAPDMASALISRFPRTVIVSTETPPYHDLDEHELNRLVDRIKDSEANMVWVGLGTPRQDYLVPRLSSCLNMPIVPIGAAFDFLSGRVKEAPRWLRGTGFEWLYRFTKEPKRLWRRYLLGNPRFIWHATKERWGSQ